MISDEEYIDMNICPNCLKDNFDCVCDSCQYIDYNLISYNERRK